MLIFDIETGPLDRDTVLRFSPEFEPPPHPEEFDPSSVKCGNIGGPDSEKGKAKIEDARKAHQEEVAKYAERCAFSKASHEAECLERAPLSPVTGRVVAIGCWSATTGKVAVIGEPPEQWPEGEILAKFWGLYRSMKSQNRKMCGCNIFGFDLPFLIRRSWILGVEVPAGVREGRYWDRLWLDLRDEWLLGQRWGDCESSLDHMARALGAGQKADAEGCDGATFHKLWMSGDKEQVAKARGYLVNDLEMTRRVAERMGVV